MVRIAIQENAVPGVIIGELAELGYNVRLTPAGSSSETLSTLEDVQPDIVVLEEEEGAEAAIVAARKAFPRARFLLAVGNPSADSGGRRLADLYVPRNADPTLWTLAVVSLRLPPQGSGDELPRRSLVTLVNAAHRAFKAIDEGGNGLLENLRHQLEGSFEVLLRFALERLEAGIDGLAGHSVRTADLARRLASELGLDREDVDALDTAGIFHDLGMHIVASPAILGRAGPLAQSEWDLIRAHPAASSEAIAPLPQAGRAWAAIRDHHERLDGSGYPLGKRGGDVPLSSRILAVADSFEATTHDRPYRPAMPEERALELIGEDERRGRLDPDVCEALRSTLQGRRQQRPSTGLPVAGQREETNP